MLSNLYIENVAVIEKASIDFTQGFNILTGETGAGKSIIIDSINAIIGNRILKDLIRTGAETAFISAEFTDLSPSAVEALKQADIELDDDILLIQRKININGKSKCRINGRPASVGVLREIGVHLINIHGQHEGYALMSPESHITYIDKLGQLEDEVDSYRTVYKQYQSLCAKLRKATMDETERERKMDLLRYQIDEIEAADLQTGEYEELIEQKRVLQNSEKISYVLEEAKGYLNGSDESDGALQLLDLLSAALNRIASLLPDTEHIQERLQNASYEIRDCYEEISDLSNTIYEDEDSLNDIEARLDLIHTLSRKYGNTIPEILQYLERSKSELQYLEQYGENRQKLQDDCDEAHKQSCKLAQILSEKRKKVGLDFALSVKKELTFLDMPNVELVVSQKSGALNDFGCDNIELLISANPGEPPKPIAKIASGGELSRIMLAIKNVLADKDDINTLIFDEVDTGISGNAAQKVGLKLHAVSENQQVLCVTHLASIAAMANSHFKIIKEVHDGRTFTQVLPLNHEARRDEIARMISGAELTDAALNYAEDMLSRFDNNKQN